MSIIGNPILLGSGGLSKCSIIVNIDTGSTVAAYSNAAATTLVKTGKEIGTSGNYIITGLNTGTYYIKATKGSKSKISSAVTFSAFGIKVVSMAYEFVIFRDGVLNSSMGNLKKISGGGNTSSWQLAGGNLVAYNETTSAGYANIYVGFDNPINISGFSTLHVRAKNSNHYLDIPTRRIGLSETNTQDFQDITVYCEPDDDGEFAEYTVDLRSLTGSNYYLIVFQNLKASYNKTGDMTTTISEMWLT